jgi:tetrahydromethanopterin S-methyltransferase subunit F
MVQISNKPNVRGLKNTAEEIEYSSKLIGREGRAYTALSFTRAKGIAIGITLAFVLLILLPYIAKLCGL